MAPAVEAPKLTKFFGAPMKGRAPLPTSLPPSQTQQAPSTPATPSKRKRASDAAKISPAKGKNKAVRKGQLKQKKQNAKKKVQRKPGTGRTAKWGLLMKAGLKAPKTSYTLWAADNQQRIQKELGTTNLIEVGKATGAQWKSLSEDGKAPYKARQRELSAKFMIAREAYNEYCKGRGSNKDKDVTRRKRIQKTANKRTTVGAQKSRTAKVSPQSKELSEAATADATQRLAILPASQASKCVASRQPEAGASQHRRAFKMPDEAGVVALIDLDATQQADPVVAAAAWE